MDFADNSRFCSFSRLTPVGVFTTARSSVDFCSVVANMVAECFMSQQQPCPSKTTIPHEHERQALPFFQNTRSRQSTYSYSDSQNFSLHVPRGNVVDSRLALSEGSRASEPEVTLVAYCRGSSVGLPKEFGKDSKETSV